MKKNLTVMLIATLFVGQAFGASKHRPSPRPSPSVSTSPTPIPSYSPVIIPEGVKECAQPLIAGFIASKGYDVKNAAQLKLAEKKVNEVLCSPCFADFMLKRKLINTKGKSNTQVINDLRSTPLTVPAEIYYADNRVVGYRQPPSPVIHSNGKFAWGSTPCNRGSNLIHEWSHVRGYGHSFKPTKSRPYSVPYSLNAVMRACCIN
jgi:hypothetical protein